MHTLCLSYHQYYQGNNDVMFNTYLFLFWWQWPVCSQSRLISALWNVLLVIILNPQNHVLSLRLKLLLCRWKTSIEVSDFIWQKEERNEVKKYHLRHYYHHIHLLLSSLAFLSKWDESHSGLWQNFSSPTVPHLHWCLTNRMSPRLRR